MSVKSLNLSKKADFALATGSAVATVGQLFGKNPEEWEIDEASYNAVTFHVLTSKSDWGGALPSIRDTGGRRLAKFRFPYRDGQTTDDLGREAETFDLDILIFGNDYKRGLVALMNELQDVKPGVLLHPVRGLINCKMDKYELIHQHDQRKAVALKVTFVEHNFELASYGEVGQPKDSKSLLSAALGVFKVINDMINKAKALQNLANALVTIIEEVSTAYKLALQETSSDLNLIFSKGNAVDLLQILPVNQGGVLRSDGTLTATTFPVVKNPQDPFAAIPVTQIQAQIQANRAVYATEQYENAGLLSDPGASLQAQGNLSQSVAAIIVQNKVNATRVLAETLIQTLNATKLGASTMPPLGEENDGALIFYNEILDIKRSINLLQKSYELGSAANNIGIKIYKVPYAMSLREACFRNGISVERVAEIDVLNPECKSVNLVEKNTELIMVLQ